MNNCFLALVVVLVLGVAAAQSPEQRLERFELFNDCEPMYLLVERLPADAAGIGLSEQRVQAAVESRLRSARLYDSFRFANTYLYIRVAVVGGAFHISFEFNQRVRTLDSGLTGTATTWRSGITGTHGRDAGYIMSAVSELMDFFLSEYLRVNEEAC